MSAGERGAVRKKGAALTSKASTTTSSGNNTTTSITTNFTATTIITPVKNGQSNTGIGAPPEETPNHIVYKKVGWRGEEERGSLWREGGG